MGRGSAKEAPTGLEWVWGKASDTELEGMNWEQKRRRRQRQTDSCAHSLSLPSHTAD
ncbi:hypothetical protein E2C01_093261 [Portunus trituberculatus]|uniref:Uncharacterized protein n=1 Tax=Portunus trituberculatus TaxID=210409 RepID=A0A5B7JXM6_PORTR|nr:hypothetical protein [Portunus trituberculatus]